MSKPKPNRFLVTIQGTTGKKNETELIHNLYVPHILLMLQGLSQYKPTVEVSISEVSDEQETR